MKDGYSFTFHFRGKQWQDKFYNSLAWSIANMGTATIIDNGIEVLKVECNVSISPRNIVSEIVLPNFDFYGNQGNWELVCTNSLGKVLV